MGEKDDAINDLIARWHRTERRWHTHHDNFPNEAAYEAAHRQYHALTHRIIVAEGITLADMPIGRKISSEDRYRG